MIYLIPTKKGIGVELWGTYDDLNNFYEVIQRFWNDESKVNFKGYENRDRLISSFSYEIRKAKDGSRLQRNSGHFSFEEIKHLGTKISWVHFLFFMTTLKFNMRFSKINKFDIAMILQIEFWLEKAMFSYDESGAIDLVAFIEDALYGGNDYIYNYMRSVNQDYFLLGGGKRAFKKLPQLLKRGIYFTQEYKEYAMFLQDEAERLGCSVNELELDDDIIYDINW